MGRTKKIARLTTGGDAARKQLAPKLTPTKPHRYPTTGSATKPHRSNQQGIAAETAEIEQVEVGDSDSVAEENDQAQAQPMNQEEHEHVVANEGEQELHHGGIFFDASGGSDQFERYKVLISRGLANPRYYHPPSLDHLGLRAQVEKLFSNIGWGVFLTKVEGVHRAPVYEFLSSLVVVKKGGTTQIRFRNNSEWYTFPERVVAQAFGFPMGAISDTPNEWTDESRKFWHKIACDRDMGDTYMTLYRPSRSKATEIFNPCLRIAQKIAANSVLGREDSTGCCGSRELFVLKCMLECTPLNPTSWLLNQMTKLGKKTGRKHGAIVVGGMVMILLRHLGLVIQADPIPISPTFFDLDKMKSARILQMVDDIWWASHRESRLYTLPNLPLTDPVIPANLLPNPRPESSWEVLVDNRKTELQQRTQREMPLPPEKHLELGQSSTLAMAVDQPGIPSNDLTQTQTSENTGMNTSSDTRAPSYVELDRRIRALESNHERLESIVDTRLGNMQDILQEMFAYLRNLAPQQPQDLPKQDHQQTPSP